MLKVEGIIYNVSKLNVIDIAVDRFVCFYNTN
jgi:hypothetical protein